MEMILILEFKYRTPCHLQKQNQLKYETLQETKEDMIAASRNMAERLLKSFQPTSNNCFTKKKKTSNK